jgi:hypothetical protein
MIRRSIVVTVVCALALVGLYSGAGPAFGNKPSQIYENNVHFACDQPGVTTEHGTVLVFVEDSSEFGASGSILWWVPPETIENTGGDATYRSSSLIEDQQVTRTGYHFEAVLAMEDRDFNPLGDATISVDLIPTGRVDYASPEKDRFGNRFIRDNSVVKFFSVAGTVTMFDGTVFNITNCGGPDGSGPDTAGFDTTTDIRISDPSQFVLKQGGEDGVLVLCDITTETHSFNLGASTGEAGSDASIFFTPAVGPALFGQGPVTLSTASFEGSIALQDENGEPAGDAVIDATFTRRDRTAVRQTVNGVRDKMVGWLLETTGTVTLPTAPATVIDLSSCFVFNGTETVKEHRPKAG